MVHWDVLTVRHTSPRRLDVGLTLGPLGHGPGDPTFHRAADGSVWRTSLLRAGPVTQRFVPAGPHEVVVHLWGDGAREAAEALPVLLGEDDDAAGFVPPPQAAVAHRRAVTVCTRCSSTAGTSASSTRSLRTMRRPAARRWAAAACGGGPVERGVARAVAEGAERQADVEPPR